MVVAAAGQACGRIVAICDSSATSPVLGTQASASIVDRSKNHDAYSYDE
jgi:hypothetical protein